jgi:hypothetical protein
VAAEEDHNGGRSPSDSPTKVDHSFDDLARAVAEGSLSRRGALKLFAGAAIAALIPSRALADDDDCVRVCHVPRTSTGECDFANARTRCVSRRERRRHLNNHDCDTRGRCQTQACPAGRVLLDNGTCARPCPESDNCAGCAAGCVFVSATTGYCGSGGTDQSCTADIDCPTGQFCFVLGFCVVAC